MTSSAFAFVAFVLSIAALWTTVVWMMPAVARARVQRQAERASDRINDAMLSGDIAFDNPRASDALMFCHVLEEHSRDLTFSTALGTLIASRLSGVDITAEQTARQAKHRLQSDEMASHKGTLVLAATERYLVRILAHYYVRGSALWWIFVPLQRMSWFLRSKHVPAAAEISHAIDQPLPGDIARRVWEDSRGSHIPAAIWTGRFANAA